MSSYIILPFNFKYSDDTVLMVNQAGEWIIARRDDFDKFHSYKLQPQNEFYKRLKAKHFLTVPEEKEQVLNLLAIKLRTRKAFAQCSPNLHMIVATLRCNCLCKVRVVVVCNPVCIKLLIKILWRVFCVYNFTWEFQQPVGIIPCCNLYSVTCAYFCAVNIHY